MGEHSKLMLAVNYSIVHCSLVQWVAEHYEFSSMDHTGSCTQKEFHRARAWSFLVSWFPHLPKCIRRREHCRLGHENVDAIWIHCAAWNVAASKLDFSICKMQMVICLTNLRLGCMNECERACVPFLHEKQ